MSTPPVGPGPSDPPIDFIPPQGIRPLDPRAPQPVPPQPIAQPAPPQHVAQPYPPHQQYAQPYPPQQPARTPDPRKRKPSRKLVALVVVLAVVVAGGAVTGILLANRSPAARPVPVEAIDLPTKPTFGAPWSASEDDPGGEGLEPQVFVTPCGVLVTVLESDVPSSGARIMGHKISTGKQLWSQDLRSMTGQSAPVLNGGPTYTSDCWMVQTFQDSSPQTDRLNVGVAIDVATGDFRVLDSDGVAEVTRCEAAGEGWAACWSSFKGVEVNNIHDPDQTWYLDSSVLGFDVWADIVVDGAVWTDEGYRDPASWEVLFGADARSGATSMGLEGSWVVYREPHRPGGYRSGVAVRMAGDLGLGRGTCETMAWDTAADKGLWTAPASFPCGEDYMYEWTLSGSVLLLTLIAVATGADTTIAYSLEDGRQLWKEEAQLSLSAGWNQMADPIKEAPGTSQNYAVFADASGKEYAVRVSDGARIDLAATWIQAMGDQMAYSLDTDSNSLTGYTVDPAQGDQQAVAAWEVVLDDRCRTQASTFAVGQKMYLVCGLGHSEVFVIPMGS